jgi:heat shock protein HslJ
VLTSHFFFLFLFFGAPPSHGRNGLETTKIEKENTSNEKRARKKLQYATEGKGCDGSDGYNRFGGRVPTLPDLETH